MRKTPVAAHPGPARRLTAGLLLAALGASACGGERGEGQSPVVARVGEESLRRAELEQYFSLNLPEGPAEDALPVARDETDRVKSRLLDSWIDERLLLQEARRRGISLSDEEVAAAADAEFAGAEAQASVPPRDLQLRIERTRLVVERLQTSLVAGAPPPTEQEIRAHVERERGLRPSRGLAVRALMLDSAETAARLYAEIRGGALSFSDAVAAHDTSPAQGLPLILPLDSLPPGFGAALQHLKPGEVSPPLEFHGDAYLFEIASATDAEVASAEVHEQAAAELERRRLERATRDLLQSLRSSTALEIRRRQLPFSYVAAEPAPGPPDLEQPR